MFAAWFGGFQAGLFATVLSVATNAYFLVEPLGSFEIMEHRERLRIVLFAGVSLLLSAIIAWLRRAEGRAMSEVVRQREVLEREVAERKRVERQLRQNEEHWRLFVEQTPVPVAMFDRDMRYVAASRRWLADFKLENEPLIGRSHYEVFPDIPDRWRDIHKRCLAGATERSDEDAFERADGTVQWLRWEVLPWHGIDKAIGGIIIFSEDITGRKRVEQALRESEARIRHLAYYDALTHLPNRAFFQERLQSALTHSERHDEPMAVFVLDLDHFKHINDSLGHLIGDALLQEAATRMRASVREQDTVARPGGDEFMLVLPNTDADGAARTAEKIVKVLSQPMLIEGHELHVSCSLGISLYPDNGRRANELLQNADVAMYRAKQRGRNTYQFYTEEMQREAVRTLNLEQCLRQALERDELLLHYQPQVDLRDGRVVGCEALLRWRHPDWGMVEPDRFIPVAEESGLIREIGLWVLRRAALQMKSWERAGRPPMPTSVNLSAIQFHRNHHRCPIGDQVARVLKETGIAPEWLELEITETGLMQDKERAALTLSSLRDMGVRVAIDDFGIGYSSLNYLKQFPVSRLKIDRSFVRDIALDPGDEAIIDTIISLGRNFGITVVAEGVETEQQLRKLRDKGCEQAQGFYFSKPLPVEELETWLPGKR